MPVASIGLADSIAGSWNNNTAVSASELKPLGHQTGLVAGGNTKSCRLLLLGDC